MRTIAWRVMGYGLLAGLIGAAMLLLRSDLEAWIKTCGLVGLLFTGADVAGTLWDNRKAVLGE
jgi:hypothetical protein